MNILTGGKWLAGFPDYHRAPGQIRVQVLALRNLGKVDGMYFVRPRSVRLLVNYLFEFGPRGVFRKVRSRLGETMRNEKLVSAGIGKVQECDPGSPLQAGSLVAFLAPCHPACVERLSLLPEFVVPFDGPAPTAPHLLYKPETDPVPCEMASWRAFMGFSEHSGLPVNPTALQALRQDLPRLLKATDWTGARDLPFSEPPQNVVPHEMLLSGPGERLAPCLPEAIPPAAATSDGAPHGPATSSHRRPRGTVFGYGNYAKSFLIPNASPFIDITAIHEIDPTQIARDDRRYAWDTAPLPRSGEAADVFFGSGYHHTHVPVALGALSQGAYAVIEKPVAVDEPQLVELLAALRKSGPKLFSCYHKRYIPFNEYAREDLGLQPGEPVSYSCQVFEVPLPPLHWYHWPNAKSRLVSNGCHWIDHFLYLNGYPEVRSYDLVIAPDETLNVSVTAANGAFFTMVLTDQGSERVGLRDHIELRTKRSTVRMIDGSNYVAEGPDRIIRQATINKLFSYQNMYRTISRKIAAGEAGDTIDSVRISAGLVLDLERLFQKKRQTDLAQRGT